MLLAYLARYAYLHFGSKRRELNKQEIALLTCAVLLFNLAEVSLPKLISVGIFDLVVGYSAYLRFFPNGQKLGKPLIAALVFIVLLVNLSALFCSEEIVRAVVVFGGLGVVVSLLTSGSDDVDFSSRMDWGKFLRDLF